MSKLDRIREAKAAARNAAIRRWVEHAPEREKKKREIAVGGEGAADTPQREARFKVRQGVLESARKLRSQGLLPRGIERKMGPTLDWTPFAPSEAARTAGRPVARIVTIVDPRFQAEGYGTGFLVTPTLLMTNHHVFPTRGDAVGQGANFGYERAEGGTQAGLVFELDPERFYVADERLDFAVVALKSKAVGGQSTEPLGVITLIEATPKILVGQQVNIIQHPEGGAKTYAITANRLLNILDEGFLQYETDTEEGSSGSPAFSGTWELVGLHHASIPEIRDGRAVRIDGGPWDDSMPDDLVRWIANEGTRVSAIVKSLAAMQPADARERQILQELLATTTDPVDDLARTMGESLPVAAGPGRTGGMLGGGAGMAHNQFVFSGPVTIHVYGPPASAGTVAGASVGTEPSPAALVAPEKTLRFDPAYDEREGYDPAFLDPNGGIVVPVPTVDPQRDPEILKGANGASLVLKYHHFELVTNEARRLQMWSAVNVDYDPEKKPKGGRASFGKDRWVPDPRIPARAQIFDADFYKPAGKVDRGHMVRREDNAWGVDEEEMEFANSDTFHWPNCTPQHEAFNRSDPGGRYGSMQGLWGGFENHIQEHLEGGDHEACLLAGPVLDNANDPSADFGLGPVQYPTRFWKVVAVTAPKSDGSNGRELQAFGFLLSQASVVKKFGIERFDPGRFERHQVPLTEIEQTAGVVFDPLLHGADMMAGAQVARIDSLDEVRGLRRRAA